MLTKVLIFVAVLVGVFIVARLGASSAFRPSLGGKKKTPKTGLKTERGAEDLKQCPVCGAWSAQGEGCPCGGTPTP